jgi:hypothetical protein
MMPTTNPFIPALVNPQGTILYRHFHHEVNVEISVETSGGDFRGNISFLEFECLCVYVFTLQMYRVPY